MAIQRRMRVSRPMSGPGYKRKRSMSRRSMSRSIPRTPTNKHTFVTLPFSSYLTLNEATAGAGKVHTWRPNSAFDPDIFSASTQPLGFDQYSGIFQKYLVYGGNWEVTFANQLIVNNGLAVVGAQLTTDLNMPVSPIYWPANNGTQSKLIGNGTGNGTATFKGKINIARAFGVSQKQIWNETNYEAAVNSSPINQLFLNVFTIGQAASTSFVTVHCKIWMKVRFSGRLNLQDV